MKAKRVLEKLRNGIRWATTAVEKAWWRARHGVAGEAVPVFIVGAQRSGTTILGDCLGRSPEVEYHPESDPQAFDRFILREDRWRDFVRQSRHPFVVFKPLTDSHRVGTMLKEFDGARALWVVRHFGDRARSAVTKFGEHNREILARLARGERPAIWQSQGLTDEDFELIAGFDYERMDPWSASALFWYLRNKLFFKQGLELRPEVGVLCYEHFVTAPEERMRGVCRFLGARFYDRMVRGVHVQSVAKRGDAVQDDRIRALCEDLYARLEALGQTHFPSSALEPRSAAAD